MQHAYVTVGEIARQYGVAPRLISDAFYARKLDDGVCILISGRRLIPASYVADIVAFLRLAGHLGTDRKRPLAACNA